MPSSTARCSPSASATAHAVAGRAIRFSTPTFKSYSSCELSGCGKNSFPAFSVTAGGCALDVRSLPGEDPRADDSGG